MKNENTMATNGTSAVVSAEGQNSASSSHRLFYHSEVSFTTRSLPESLPRLLHKIAMTYMEFGFNLNSMKWQDKERLLRV